MVACEGECWCRSLHTLCPVGGVIPWVPVRESAGVYRSLHTLCPVGGVIPWVHVRESAGVWVPAHTVPSGRGYTMGAECWSVGPCTHCAQ